MDAVQASQEFDYSQSVAYDRETYEVEEHPDEITMANAMVYMDGALSQEVVEQMDFLDLPEDELERFKRDVQEGFVNAENLEFLSDDRLAELQERADEFTLDEEAVEAMVEVNTKARSLTGSVDYYDTNDVPVSYEFSALTPCSVAAACVAVVAVAVYNTAAAVHTVAAAVAAVAAVGVEVKVG